jgi:hypothetical protein
MTCLMVGTAGFVAYAFETFQTKDSCNRNSEQIDRRLERIENKIDAILQTSQSNSGNTTEESDTELAKLSV